MKIRNGFVSNSSSSSFLIAIGEVGDMKLFREVMEKHQISKYDIEFVAYNYNTDSTELSIESFDGSSVKIDKSKLSEGDTIFKFNYYGDEGDGYFSNDEGDDINYDIDFGDFPANIVDFINDINICTINMDYTYGAGRNG